jgi:hypothetical protein
MKTITLIFAIIFSISASAQRRGGIGDGGGNAIAEELLPAHQITYLLGKAKEPTFYVLRHLEYFGVKQEVSEKIFRGPKTIYQVLAEAQFDPVDKGGCEGIGGSETEHDANSLKTYPKICFSLESLSQKLHERSGKPQLIALIIHELSHVVGATEDEAQELQRLVLEKTSNRIFDVVPELVKDYDRKLEEMQNNVEGLLALMQVSELQACMGFEGVMFSAFQLNDHHSEFQRDPGISVIGVKGIFDYLVFMMKSYNLTASCYKSSPKYQADLDKVRKLFANKDKVKAIEFFRTTFSSDPGPDYPLPDVDIRRVTGKDRKNRLIEIKEMSDILKRLRASLYSPTGSKE